MAPEFGKIECSAWTFDNGSNVKYLNRVSKILAKYSWIYNVRNVDLFLHDVLEKIPLKWIEALTALSFEDLGKIAFGFMKDEWPDSLKAFIVQCQELGNVRFPSKKWSETKQNLQRPQYTVKRASFKKQYEIEIMSSLISKVCQEFNCFDVLDIGSGLGYLDQILHHDFGLRCICLDSSAKYTLAAKERLKNDPCVDAMYHKTLEVKDSVTCLQELKVIIKEDKNWKCNCNFKTSIPEECQSGPLVLVGLHSCGNLMQDMMKLFCQMEELVAFVCVGCCYNKVNLNDFPMSAAARVAQAECPSWRPCVSGLRLAAHGTRSLLPASLMDLHVERNLFYRALLEYYVKTENITWRQPKRHLRSTDIVDFETYCMKMLEEHPLCNDETTLKNLSDLYQQKKHLLPRIKILLVLQTLLQPLWEGFITVDRMLYFEEKNIEAEVISMWDDAKSSRNLALCAYKR